MRLFTPRQKPIERFIVRAQREWGFFYVDEETGVFAAYTSFGTFAYCWAHRGPGETLKAFLLDLDFDYFMTKTRGNSHLEFDFDGSVADLKRQIVDTRRSGGVTKEAARGAWEELEDLSDESEHAFFDSLHRSPQLDTMLNGYFGECIAMRPGRQSTRFWEVLWPEFLKQTERKEKRSWRSLWWKGKPCW